MKKLITLLLILNVYVVKAQTGMEICQMLHQSANNLSINSSLPSGYSVSHYNIYIDTIQFSAQKLYARTGVNIIADAATLNAAELMLLGFDIDSVYANGYNVTYNYNDTIIDLQFTPAVTQGDSIEVWIAYHGTPATDLSGWGGFYFNGSFAFNLGVGFLADPHNYGRAWFPCIDEFVSRSTYDFYITTDNTSKAFCNGVLQQSVVNPNGTVTWHWKMSHTIPSYLASMAVAPYHTLTATSNGIPVEWACLVNDTNAVKGTFSNLDTTLSAFINAYGPYPFDKIGYCLVPFNAGAMEHASSIHIGKPFVNGSQTYATLWAHELSHMWWGDKVTCESAEEMWLNEGFASYNEAYYTLINDGIVAYRNWIRTNHRKVLQFAHTPAQDGSYLTMNNIPHEYTYGYHVYQKGANIVHTLKNYMGEQNFFNGCQAYMNNRAYNHANSLDLRDELISGSGIDVTRFFDDWILTPGFPHFSIDSVVYIPGGLDHYFVYTRQRTKGNNNHLYEMPIELNFTNGLMDTSVIVTIDSLTNMFHIPLYFYATHVMLDRYGKVSDARVSNEKYIVSTGTNLIAETGVSLNVAATGNDTTWIRVVHNFVPPDPFIGSNPGIRLSDYRYWKIDAEFATGYEAATNFIFDGSVSSTTGYLDNTLITGTEDSLVMLYRQGAGFEWNIVNGYTVNTGGNPNDKRGSITVDSLMVGEYALGYFDYLVGNPELNQNELELIQVTPNPSTRDFYFSFNISNGSGYQLSVYDLNGKILYEKSLEENQKSIIWNSNELSSGIYFAALKYKGKTKQVIKLIRN